MSANSEHVRNVDGVWVYHVPYPSLFAEADIIDVREALFHLVEGRQSVRLAIDMSGVESVSSRVLGALVGVKKAVGKSGGMALFGLSATLKRLFDVTQMTSLFIIAEHQDGAVAALNQPAKR